MNRKSVLVVAGISILGALEAAPARAQQAETARLAGDTAKRQTDSTKRLDSLRSADVDTKKTESASTESASSNNLRSLGKVDGGIRLAADLSSRTLTVVGQNGAIRTFNVAIGAPSYPTPTGTYKIRKIVWNPSWVPPDSKWAKGKTAKGPGEKGNPMKVAKIFFKEPDFYIHGTGQINSLGTADSHGCLRMHPDEVAELAQFLMQNGGQAREEGWFSRVVHMRWKTHTVYLSEPVTLTITR
jgi:lipoprotein-anchoring transpeptidase ErfK/SrfK